VGGATQGIGEKFSLRVVAHARKDRLQAGDVLEELPIDLLASDPVIVTRAR
jgi:hypothetical protein